MENPLKKVVERIFNNWTGLRLAVEHEMGGPDSKQSSLECLDWMSQFCASNPDVHASDIQEALDDIIDDEFDMVCEDGSTKEIATLLHRFIQLHKEGNMAEFELQYNNLPVASDEWLVKSQSKPTNNDSAANSRGATREGEPVSTDESDSDDPQEPMEQEDPEWTVVKSRRHR